MSSYPALASMPLPKSWYPRAPVAATSPLASTATPRTTVPSHRRDQSRAPAGEYFSTPELLETRTSPQGSTATAAPCASPVDHRGLPTGESFTRKPSPETELIGPHPKSIVPEKVPVTAMLPARSTATPLPASYHDPPPKARDQTCVPVGPYFATKIAVSAVVNAPPPKSTEPWKLP